VSAAAGPGDPRAWLTTLEHFGIKLGLSGIQTVCAALGHPERRIRAVHVAGTNGKGSVAAMVDEALRAQGYRVGRYTSPHLVRLEERVTIAGRPVSAEVLDRALDTVRRTIGELMTARALDAHPTYFEVTTAAAFLVFAQAAVDLAVVEVGLGGRFDATNVLQPLIVAITSIALDHEQHLGHAVDAIAFEKAGIVKPGVPTVIGGMADEARAVIRRTCEERRAPLYDAASECHARHQRQDGRTRVGLTTPVGAYPPVTLALRGDHQVGNAVVAVRLLEILNARGVAVSEAAILAGLTHARWPGRLDLVDAGDGREALVDGAHNPAGALALASYIGSEWPAGLPLVFGAMRDKDLAGMLRPLVPVARPLIPTTAPGTRAAASETIAQVARAQGATDLFVCPDVGDALAAAWARAARIAAGGSLYLAGRVLALLGCDPMQGSDEAGVIARPDGACDRP
jgi:dihydrofolate synthase / folylpolyglutamate synthase